MQIIDAVEIMDVFRDIGINTTRERLSNSTQILANISSRVGEYGHDYG